jgi:hypothetical protein
VSFPLINWVIAQEHDDVPQYLWRDVMSSEQLAETYACERSISSRFIVPPQFSPRLCGTFVIFRADSSGSGIMAQTASWLNYTSTTLKFIWLNTDASLWL